MAMIEMSFKYTTKSFKNKTIEFFLNKFFIKDRTYSSSRTQSDMKYYLVTGISTGIGHAIAQCLLKQGHFVFGSVRKAEDALRLKKQWADQFYPLLFDVTDVPAIAKAAKEVEGRLEGQLLSGLVNNAGIVVSGPLMHVPAEDLSYQLEVNVVGVLKVCQAFLPMLGARLPALKPAGRIINISSVSGRIAAPFVGPYAASKHALEALTHSLRRELILYGIDVLSIQPGPIKTPIWEKALQSNTLFAGTDYEFLLPLVEKQVRNSEKQAIPAERVAEVVSHALQTRRPKTSYIVGANKWQYRLLYSFVPDRLMDYFIRKGFEKALKS